MFCLVLLIVFEIFKADAILYGYGPRPVGSDIPHQRGFGHKQVQTIEAKNTAIAAGKTEIAEVRLNRYGYNDNLNFTAWIDEPLKIIIENFDVQYIWCFNLYVKSPRPEMFVPETEIIHKSYANFTIPKVTAEMNTKWKCTVLQEYHGGMPYNYRGCNYTATELCFYLYLKGTKQVILTANNQNLKYDVKTNLSVEYNRVANYNYKDGEDVKFSCKKAKNYNSLSDTVRLEYFNAKGIRLFQTEPGKKKYIFRSVLNSTNDKYYLDCICTSVNPFREYRYRTTFYMKEDAEHHAIKLSINGQRLTTLSNNDTSVDHYIFRYINGEVLYITCEEVHSFPKGTIHFDLDPKIKYREDPNDQKTGIISLRLFASNVNNTTLTCGINNSKVYKPTVKLLFLSDVPDNGVRVRGLPRNNVLYQYTNDLGPWTIGYQYSVNDTLSLTCVAKSMHAGYNLRGTTPRFRWTVGGGPSFDSPANWTQTLPSIKTSELTITENLNTSLNGTKIKCTYFPKGKSDTNDNKTVEIILQLKPNQNEIVNETNSSEIDMDEDITMIVPIAVAFGVAVTIITVLCVICWHKRTKRVNLIENAYDNLSNQNDSPIPAFPSQWESNYDDSHYASIDDEVMQENYNYSTDESLCKMPYKRASNNSENHYTEIDDYFKHKPDGLTANWNSAQPSNNKNTSAPKGTASQNSNNAIYNNSTGTYDKLMRNNLPINKDNENYSNVQSKGKNKSVTFRKMSNDSRTASKYNEGNSRQDYRKNDQRFKPNSDGLYANTDQDIYMQPGVMQKKPCYENNFIKNKDSINSADLDYAEPYDFGISCKK